MEKAIIVGAGPCGLSTAIELKKRGIDALVIEKGAIVNTIYHYPTHMTFFSTANYLEIGEVPFISQGEKPTRSEALIYYREVANRFQLRIRAFEKVENIVNHKGYFTLYTTDKNGRKWTYTSKNVIISTGYYDNPNFLGIPGESLDKVSHYFKEAHPYHDRQVAIIGGKNSAVDAAIQLERAGARVTVVYRGETYSQSIKPWVLPLFEGVVRKGKVNVYWNARVTEIQPDSIVIQQGDKKFAIKNDFVFALTGYRPDRSLLESVGVTFDDATGIPMHHPDSMETNVSNLFISGVIAAGNDANVIFIENGRFHGALIAEKILSNS